MAFVPGYEFDVFISYAHTDNLGGLGKPWVSQLAEQLKIFLRQRTGSRGVEEIKIFRDEASAGGGNHDLSHLVDCAAKSAVFLAVGSPSYVASPHCRDEVEAFVNASQDDDSLFCLQLLPLPDEAYHPRLGRKSRRKFFYRRTEMSPDSTITLEAQPALYFEAFEALAISIADKLLQLHHKPIAPQKPAAPTPQTKSKTGPKLLKTILLAKTVGALEEELEGLHQTLLQYDDELTVVSAEDYPLGYNDFSTRFTADIADADLFVQLLGKTPARTPPDFPEGYTAFQLRLASENKVPILQWRPADLDLASVTDPTYLKMLGSETVEVSGMEALKRKIRDFAKKVEQPPPPPSEGTILFINAHSADRRLADGLLAKFAADPVEIRFPASLFAGENNMSSEAISTDLVDNILESNMLVFVYGDSSQEWIRTQLKALSKSRALMTPEARRSKKLEIVYIFPPPDKPKPGFFLPNVQTVESPADGDVEHLYRMIREAGA